MGQPGDAPDLPAPPVMPNLGEAFIRPYQDADRIAADLSAADPAGAATYTGGSGTDTLTLDRKRHV